MDWKDKKVLVNGVTGFLGSNIARNLLNMGAQIYSIDNFTYTNVEMAKKKLVFLDKIKIIKADVSKQESWEEVPKDIDYIFHFAAPSSIVLFKKFPEICYNETFWGLYNAFEFAKKNKVKKVIYPSSGSVYSGNVLPHSESVYPKPTNLYAACKLACEGLASSYSNFVKIVGLRISASYGPGEEWKEDFGCAPFLFIRDLIAGKAPEIWGDGKQTRDFVYVDDAVSMIIKSAEIDYTGLINIGSGEETSFKELVAKIKKILNSDVEPTYIPREVSYVERIKVDMARNNTLFGIKTISMDEGLKNFIDYLKASS